MATLTIWLRQLIARPAICFAASLSRRSPETRAEDKASVSTLWPMGVPIVLADRSNPTVGMTVSVPQPSLAPCAVRAAAVRERKKLQIGEKAAVKVDSVLPTSALSGDENPRQVTVNSIRRRLCDASD